MANFSLILMVASLVSAAFIPGGTAPENALKKRSHPMQRLIAISDNPGYLRRIFKRASEQATCPDYFNPCAGGKDAGCCAYNENCVVVSNNQLGCCSMGDVCNGDVQTRTTIKVPHPITITGSKVTLPSININIGTIAGITIGNLKISLPNIAFQGGVSTTYKQIVLDTPQPRVTGDNKNNNATFTPTPTGTFATELSESGTGSTEIGTESGTESGATATFSETTTQTITTGPSLSMATGSLTGAALTTSSSNSGASGVGANREGFLLYAFSGLLAVIVGFAVAA